MARRETPYKRVNPSGKTVFVARYTNAQGRRVSAGTFDLKRDAQNAINAAYEAMDGAGSIRSVTVGSYFATWLRNHPRGWQSNQSYGYRVKGLLDVPIEGVEFRDWQMGELRRRHVRTLLTYLLDERKRSASTVNNSMRVLSGMWNDAMDDDVVELNPFERQTVRTDDPRIQTPKRPIRIWSWEQMHDFARTAAALEDGPPRDALWRRTYSEAFIRCLSDCGIRVGEALALQRADVSLGPCAEHDCSEQGAHLHIRRTAFHGIVQNATKTKKDRVVPVSPVLESLLRSLPPRIDSKQVFPTPKGRVMDARKIWTAVWRPTQAAMGIDPRPHEFRHSFVSHMRAAGVDPADLAAMSGHSLITSTLYTHALMRSSDVVRRMVEE